MNGKINSLKVDEGPFFTIDNKNGSRPKSAVRLTTAKFRMLSNAESNGRKYSCEVEDNLDKEKYSRWDIMMQYYDIAYCGITLDKVETYFTARSNFRKIYYIRTYSLLNNLDKSRNNSKQNIKIFNLNHPKKSENSIDQMVKCYCFFTRKHLLTTLEIDIERESFFQSILTSVDNMLMEYYQFVDYYPHQLLATTLKLLQSTAKDLSKKALDVFENIFEICSTCGTGCSSRGDLLVHIETKACSLQSGHQCQCRESFVCHIDWCNHWLKPNMSCPTMSWHLWRLMFRPNKDTSGVYRCDGCQNEYSDFMRYWNHICYCPFLRVYLLANCPFCEEICKENAFSESYFQDIVKIAKADKVGIKIIKEWSLISTIHFRVKLLDPDDGVLFLSLTEDIKTIRSMTNKDVATQ